MDKKKLAEIFNCNCEHCYGRQHKIAEFITQQLADKDAEIARLKDSNEHFKNENLKQIGEIYVLTSENTKLQSSLAEAKTILTAWRAIPLHYIAEEQEIAYRTDAFLKGTDGQEKK